jgi:hypothetical protein
VAVDAARLHVEKAAHTETVRRQRDELAVAQQRYGSSADLAESTLLLIGEGDARATAKVHELVEALLQDVGAGDTSPLAFAAAAHALATTGRALKEGVWARLRKAFVKAAGEGLVVRKNWELGGRWRFLGGTPYTPANLSASSLRSNWDLRNAAIQDFSRINGVRLKSFHQLDIRLDKKYFFDRWSLNWYVDIQNAYNYKAQQPPQIVPVRDGQGNLTVNSTDPSRYQLKSIVNPGGTILPTIGLIVEF